MMQQKAGSGVLTIEYAVASHHDENAYYLTPMFQGNLAAAKLIVEEAGVTAESETALCNSLKNQLIIVAGTAPYSLVIQGIQSLPIPFLPEHRLGLYKRVPLF